jgi:hypothetical protein
MWQPFFFPYENFHYRSLASAMATNPHDNRIFRPTLFHMMADKRRRRGRRAWKPPPEVRLASSLA